MNKSLLILMSVFLCGCDSCVNDLYGVHPPSPSIAFSLDFKNINYSKFDSIIHHLEKGNCKKSGMIVEKDEKIICIENTCDCFLVKRIESKLVVSSLFSPSLQDFWITNEVEIEDSSFNNLKEELKNEIEKLK